MRMAAIFASVVLVLAGARQASRSGPTRRRSGRSSSGRSATRSAGRMTKDRPLLERIIAHDADLFMFNPDSKSTVRGWDAFVKNFDVWMDPRFKATRFDVRDLRISLRAFRRCRVVLGRARRSGRMGRKARWLEGHALDRRARTARRPVGHRPDALLVCVRPRPRLKEKSCATRIRRRPGADDRTLAVRQLKRGEFRSDVVAAGPSGSRHLRPLPHAARPPGHRQPRHLLGRYERRHGAARASDPRETGRHQRRRPGGRRREGPSPARRPAAPGGRAGRHGPDAPACCRGVGPGRHRRASGGARRRARRPHGRGRDAARARSQPRRIPRSPAPAGVRGGGRHGEHLRPDAAAARGQGIRQRGHRARAARPEGGNINAMDKFGDTPLTLAVCGRASRASLTCCSNGARRCRRQGRRRSAC